MTQEYFEGYSGSYQVTNNQRTLRKRDSLNTSAFGNIIIPGSYPARYKWTFKIENKTGPIYFGITSKYNYYHSVHIFDRQNKNYSCGINGWKWKNGKGFADFPYLLQTAQKQKNDIITMTLDTYYKYDAILRYTVNGEDCGVAFDDVDMSYNYKMAIYLQVGNTKVRLLSFKRCDFNLEKKDKLSLLMKKNKKLQQELEENKKLLIASNEEKKCSECEVIEEELDVFKSKNKGLQILIDKFKEKLKENEIQKKEQHDVLRTQYEQIKQARNIMKKRHEQQTNLLKERQNVLKNKYEIQIYRLQKQCDNQQQQMRKLKKKKKENEQFKQNQDALKKQHKTEMNKLQQQIDKKQQEIKQLNEENEQLKKNENILKKKYYEIQTNRLQKQKQREIKQSNEENQQLKQNQDALKNQYEIQINKLQQQYDNQQQETQQLSEKNWELQQSQNALQQFLTLKEEESTNYHEREKQLTKKLQTMEQHNIGLNEECKALQLELQRVQNELNEAMIINKLKNKPYPKWTSDELIMWIITIENKYFAKYQQILTNTFYSDGIDGSTLSLVNRSEIKSWGIKSIVDRANLEKHIQTLINDNHNDADHDNVYQKEGDNGS